MYEGNPGEIDFGSSLIARGSSTRGFDLPSETKNIRCGYMPSSHSEKHNSSTLKDINNTENIKGGTNE